MLILASKVKPMFKARYLSKDIYESLGPKISLISGPRQVGKTTLAKKLTQNFSYYNYDERKNIKVFLNQEWDQSTKLVIFDELHKMKKWKLWLKGLYDEERFKKQFAVVTGSARLSHLKKVGDSLAGRFYEYRLFPFDLKELKGTDSTINNYRKLLERGGFPEPLLELNLDQSRRWRRTHTDVILRQDLLSLEVIKNIDSLELLIELLATRVGSMVSFNSLAEDLKVSDITVKRWLNLLEDLYVVFRVSATSKNITRGLSKSGKYYFFDLARVEGDEAAQFENLVALSLYKHLAYIEDIKGLKTKLNFLRNKEQKEIDFFVQVQGRAPTLFEVKLSDSSVSPNFKTFAPQIKDAVQIQLVAQLDRRYDSHAGVAVEPGLQFLENLNLLSN
jgi:predicted AAA+ superfamily ATPase